MAFADPQVGRSVISGPGPSAPTVTLAGTVAEGDVIGYSSGWKRALATVGSVVNPQLIALKGGVSGDVVPVATHCVVTGYSGATAGSLVYLAEGSSSGMVTFPRKTAAPCLRVLGINKISGEGSIESKAVHRRTDHQCSQRGRSRG